MYGTTVAIDPVLAPNHNDDDDDDINNNNNNSNNDHDNDHNHKRCPAHDELGRCRMIPVLAVTVRPNESSLFKDQTSAAT